VIRLALETASAWLGVAALDGERVLAEYHRHRPMEQSAALAPAVRDVLRDAGLDLSALGELAVSRGPGSFTGLRVGAAFARALADALGVPIVPVPTAMALAVGGSETSEQRLGFGGISSQATVSRSQRGDTAGAGAPHGTEPPPTAGVAILAAAGGVAFCQRFEWRAGAPAESGPLERVEYAEVAERAGAGAAGLWVCDPAAAERLVALAPGLDARLARVEPRAAWAGIYAQRAGLAGPAREFLPLYGHSPVFRKRVRAT
jgi:tRNA threonylcarbamoyl adenosine modification protein YeaZ